MTPLRQRFIEDLQLRGLSARTQDSYVRVVRQLAEHSVSTRGGTTRMRNLGKRAEGESDSRVPGGPTMAQEGHFHSEETEAHSGQGRGLGVHPSSGLRTPLRFASGAHAAARGPRLRTWV